MNYLKTIMLGTAIAAGAVMPSYAQEKAVTIVLSEELDVIDPCMASRSNIGRVILQNVSETVIELDANGGGLKPRLAESWESKGNGTWIFKIRAGVKFSDGSDLGADDVEYSIKRTISDKITCEIGAKYFGGLKITTKVIDPTTLEVTTDPAQPILPLLMSTMTVVPTGTDLNKFVRNPIGTGPYVLSEWNAGQNIILTRNKNYWGDKPVVEKATYIFRADSAVRAAMVETGEADIVPNLSVQDATNKKLDYSYPNSETFYLRLDHSVAPFDDVRVRKALNHSIDRDAFIGSIFSDGVIKASHMVPPSTIGWNPAVKPYSFDLAKAKALLAAAKADGVKVDTPITLIGRTNNFPNVTEAMEAILFMVKEAGFKATLRMQEVAEWDTHYSKPFPEGRGPEVVEAQHDNSKGDPVFSMFFKYASKGLQSGVSDPKIDAMIAKATVSTGAEREKLWKELFVVLGDEMAADVMMFHMVGFSRVSERLNFKPSIATNSELQLSQISFK